MSGKTGSEQLKFAEFVALTAMMMSLVALSIDAMLPALTAIGSELGVLHENSNQLIISLLFLGMSAGQIIYGPLSDATGRKLAIGTVIGQSYNGTVLPLVTGFLVLGVLSLGVMLWANRNR
ncbi:MAG: hypothetical protein MI702_08255 [Chlorobiales bacterium]|nr:hypothetical protein [Chlorobiales bacterium]